MPLLNRAAKIGYSRDMYIYSRADWLYKNLVDLLDPNADRRIVKLVDLLGVYDSAAPHWVRVENVDDSVVWTCHCPYNRWFSDKELPIFRFDINQYKEALDQLKTMIDII